MIGFLLDAQLPKRLARRLELSGYRASHVFDHLDPQADDLAVAALANQLAASVVTKDADFADLANRGILQRTLVWLRVPNVSNDILWATMDRALPDIVSAVRSNLPIHEVF